MLLFIMCCFFRYIFILEEPMYQKALSRYTICHYTLTYDIGKGEEMILHTQSCPYCPVYLFNQIHWTRSVYKTRTRNPCGRNTTLNQLS